jgi:hypothetical protein
MHEESDDDADDDYDDGGSTHARDCVDCDYYFSD